MAKEERRALGKGIRALLNNIEQETQKDPEAVVQTLSSNIAHLPIEQIEVNPFQPRSEFDEAALAELSASIRVHGLIQPITVRRLDATHYQLISGERRLRASKLAGLEEIPAYVRIANDQEMLEMALVENIQRAELNPMEVAFSYQRLLDECKLTHEQVATRVAKERSTVTNYLRLLKLPPDIQSGLKRGLLTTGHARALAGVDDIALQLSLYRQTIEEALSVRRLEELIRSYNAPKADKPENEHNAKTALPAEFKRIQKDLSHRFGSKVQLKRTDKGNGQIVINYSDDLDLNRLLDMLQEGSAVGSDN